MKRLPRVGGAFRLSRLGDRGKAIHPAIAAIDAVHRDGTLAKLDIWYLGPDCIDCHGKFHHHWKTGEPFGISVKPDDVALLTFTHEVGHLLDSWCIGAPGVSFASESDPRLEPWRDAVRASQVWARYDELKQHPVIPYIDEEDGGVFLLPLDPGELAAVTQFREYFARSYAQYIATRSRDTLLMEHLNRWLARQTWILQWDHADFAPIGEAIDSLFAALGWRER